MCAPVDVSACTKASTLASGFASRAAATFSGRDRRAPVVVDDHRHAAHARRVLEHARAEHAVAAHDDLVARLHEVHEAGLHADRAGAGHGERHLVGGLECVAEELLDLLHEAHELGVQVADGGARHGLEHTRRHVGWAGAHERAQRRVERGELGAGHGGHASSLLSGSAAAVGSRRHWHVTGMYQSLPSSRCARPVATTTPRVSSSPRERVPGRARNVDKGPRRRDCGQARFGRRRRGTGGHAGGQRGGRDDGACRRGRGRRRRRAAPPLRRQHPRLPHGPRDPPPPDDHVRGHRQLALPGGPAGRGHRGARRVVVRRGPGLLHGPLPADLRVLRPRVVRPQGAGRGSSRTG